MRPPYGSYNAATKAIGLPIILWDVDTLDWKNRNASVVTQAALSATKSGSIIVLHDIHTTSVDAVGPIITGLKAKGSTFVTVPELLTLKNGQVDNRR